MVSLTELVSNQDKYVKDRIIANKLLIYTKLLKSWVFQYRRRVNFPSHKHRQIDGFHQLPYWVAIV